jgi:hypothetical protein
MQRSAKLVDDQTYITAQAKLSQFPGDYYMGFAPTLPPNDFPKHCTPYSAGCKQQHVTGDTIDTDTSLTVSKWNRVPNSRATVRTQLFGTAPYRALGDGMLNHPDTYSALWTSGFNPHCARPLTEIDFDRFECINAPLAVEDERVSGPRGGVHTRVGPALYMC